MADVLKVEKKDGIAVLQALGVTKKPANLIKDDWLEDQLNKLDDILTPDMTKKVTDKKIKAVLEDIQDALDDDVEIKVVPSSQKPGPVEDDGDDDDDTTELPPIPEDDEDEDDDEDEEEEVVKRASSKKKAAVAVKEKATKPGKGAPPPKAEFYPDNGKGKMKGKAKKGKATATGPGSGAGSGLRLERVGINDTVIDILEKSSKKNPATKEDILKVLVKKFGAERERAMKKTVNGLLLWHLPGKGPRQKYKDKIKRDGKSPEGFWLLS